MIWDKTDRFKHPEDGKFVATEYNVNPSLEPIIGGPKMVDDWKKSSVSVADSIRSRQNQSGFLPASVKGQENQHIRGRETIFSIAAERDESPGPGFYQNTVHSSKQLHVGGPTFKATAVQSRKKETDKIPDATVEPGPGSYYHRSSMLTPTFNHERSLHLEKDEKVRHQQQMQRRMSSVPNHLTVAKSAQNVGKAVNGGVGAVNRASSMYALGRTDNVKAHQQHRHQHQHQHHRSLIDQRSDLHPILFQQLRSNSDASVDSLRRTERSSSAERGSLFSSLKIIESQLHQQQQRLDGGYAQEVEEKIKSESFTWDAASPSGVNLSIQTSQLSR